ncbi:hypothetical protein HRI_000004000 [Hibiscus trionum]|uniref:Reverse transcriptase Ty1/copia-type domain-containing protein n=1 Tax=Hibiscus trionum TaxID=183268 RepID=A0A9W7LGA9_HIBTR|nr:hypothetical protein HRI_000004000 [Hibiscus trionum]
MQIPPGIKENLGKQKVCRLLKSLYGLKQSPRAWFDKFTKACRNSYVSKLKAEKGRNGKPCEQIAVSEVKKNEDKLVRMFSDASWAGELNDRRSIIGYCSFVWGNLVTWRSKKQEMVSRSSGEAEFRALALGICEGIWLQRLLTELGFCYNKHFELQSDSQSAISIAKNPVHHDRTKHVEIDRHFISEKVNGGLVKLNFVLTKGQLADILTKALPRVNFDEITSKLGLYNIHSST